MCADSPSIAVGHPAVLAADDGTRLRFVTGVGFTSVGTGTPSANIRRASVPWCRGPGNFAHRARCHRTAAFWGHTGVRRPQHEARRCKVPRHGVTAWIRDSTPQTEARSWAPPRSMVVEVLSVYMVEVVGYRRAGWRRQIFDRAESMAYTWPDLTYATRPRPAAISRCTRAPSQSPPLRGLPARDLPFAVPPPTASPSWAGFVGFMDRESVRHIPISLELRGVWGAISGHPTSSSGRCTNMSRGPGVGASPAAGGRIWSAHRPPLWSAYGGRWL